MFSYVNFIRSAVTGVSFATFVFLSTLTCELLRDFLHRRAEERFITSLRQQVCDCPPTSLESELPEVQGDISITPASVSDTAVGTSQNQSGIVFDETTVVTSTKTGPTSNLSEAVDDASQAIALLKIPVRIASGTWSTAQAVNTQLFSVNYNTAHTSNDRWADIFGRFIFYRYRLKVRVELNGTPFHQGKLLLYYSPGLPSGAQYTNLNNVTSLDHRSLYASYNNVQELRMPWQYHFDFARVDPNSSFVSFAALSIFNALETGTGGSTTINYSVWLALDDVELKVPAPITVPSSLVLDAELPEVEGLFDFSTTNINQQFSNIADSALPTNITGDKFDTALNVKGLDNPTMTLNASPIKVRAVDSLSNTTGLVNNFRMALNPSKMVDPGPEYFDVAEDEMSLKYLTSRWSVLARNINFQNNAAVGNILFSSCINPGMLGGALNNSASPVAEYRCLLGFLAQRFSRWRGSVKFAIEVISTQYQTGKLFLGFSPYYVAPGGIVAGSPDPLTNYGMIVEINKGKNVFEVTVPFFHFAEWATTQWNQANDALDTDQVGHFYVAVVNPLATVAATPNSVRLNVYVAGGDDFEFAFPFGQGSCAVLQGDVIGNYRRTRGTNTYSDIPLSIRDVVRRPWYYTSTALNFFGPIKYAVVPLDMIFTVGIDDAAAIPPTFLRMGGNFAYWASLFRGYIGDLRLKLLLTRQGADNGGAATSNYYPLYCTHIPTNFAASATNPTNAQVLNSIKLWLAERYTQFQGDGSGWVLQNTSTSFTDFPGIGTNGRSGQAPGIGAFEEVIVDPIRSIELEVPYNGVARFATRSQGNTDFTTFPIASGERSHKGGWGYLVLHQWSNGVAENAGDATWLDIHVGAGDNFRFGMHTGVPSLVAENSSTINPVGRYTN